MKIERKEKHSQREGEREKIEHFMKLIHCCSCVSHTRTVDDGTDHIAQTKYIKN